jgi:glutathione S-transferase
MNEPILHHYPASPYAEKIRLMLGFKGLKWQSVIIPEVMPKPDVVALSGGYRRTPLLQIGADVWCDTALITRVLERVAPAPTLYPYGDTLAVTSLSHFAESVLFNVAVPIAFQPEGMKLFFPGATAETFERFRADRTAMRQGGTVRRGSLAECKAVYAHFAPRIEAQFADARQFVLGSAPCAADFAVYHTLWPIGRVPGLAGLLTATPRVWQWMERMLEIGHGKHQEISSAKAIEIARASKPAPVERPVALETEALALGDAAQVTPADYALDPVKGALVSASADEIVIRRSDPRAGTVQVHFPRFGYTLAKAA